MKKLSVVALALTCAAGVFAQGTVNFANNITGVLSQRVYSMMAGNSTYSQIGGTFGAGFTALEGGNYLACLMGASGAGQPASALQFSPNTTTFRTGSARGVINNTVASFPNIAKDAAAGTFQMFVWDNSSGLYADPTAAWNAWQVTKTIAAGVSGTINLTGIGGDLNTPPNLVGLQSFNIYMIPEPSSMALAGLGAAALLIFRRRK